MSLQRRLPPAHAIRLELDTDSGMKDIRDFKMCFNVNAAAVIKEKSDVSLLNFVEAWSQIGDPRLLRLMFWASVLEHHPEYNTKDAEGKLTDEGLEAIGSLIDETVTEQVAEALWDTYLKSLSLPKRESVIKLRKMAEEQNKNPETRANPPQPQPISNPETATVKTTSGLSSGPSPDTSASESKNSAT